MWRNMPVLATVYSGQLVDPAKLRAGGFSGIIAYIGAGTQEMDRAWLSTLATNCAKVPMPLLVMYTVYGAHLNVSESANAGYQWPSFYATVRGLVYHGVVLNVQPTNEVNASATDSNTSTTMRAFANMVQDNIKKPVYIRSNDAVISGRAPSMTNWLDQFSFYLDDNRYRIKDPSGDRNLDKYIKYPSATPPILTTVAELRKQVYAPDIDHLPPDGVATPLCPGANRVFWEVIRGRFTFDGVSTVMGQKSAVAVTICTVANEQTFYNLIGFTGTTTPPPSDDPTPPPADTKVLEMLTTISEGVSAIKTMLERIFK